MYTQQTSVWLMDGSGASTTLSPRPRPPVVRGPHKNIFPFFGESPFFNSNSGEQHE